MTLLEIIRFDEHENPTTMTCFGFFGCGGPDTFPATATLNTAGSYFPTIAASPAGGAFVCPPGTTLTNGTTTLCTGTNGNPTP